METLSVDVVGQAYELGSTTLSAQTCINLFPEVHPTGKSKASLTAWPGKKTFSTIVGANRGLIYWDGHVYTVNAQTLYKVDSTGASSSLGSITGINRCFFAASSTHVYIVTGGVVYRTDGATLSTVADADLETPSSCTFLNSQIIYDGDGARFAVSDAGNGASIDGLNYATAEAKPDPLLSVYSFNQTLYLCGTETIEPWYNSGVGNPPFSKIDGGLINVGVAGIFAVTNTKDFLYFVGSDSTVYRLEGYRTQQVSTIAISEAIQGYSDISDCFCYALKWSGQSIVVFQFPSTDKTWAFNESSSSWFELSSDGGRDSSNGYVFAFGKHLVSDYQTGNLYELDKNTYTDRGNTLIRERVIAPMTGIELGMPGKRLLMSRFELIVETGVGLATGQGVDPVFMISYSDDGGRTWTGEEFVSIGVMGEYVKKVEYFQFASGYEILIKIRLSDPVFVSIHAAAADVQGHGY